MATAIFMPGSFDRMQDNPIDPVAIAAGRGGWFFVPVTVTNGKVLNRTFARAGQFREGKQRKNGAPGNILPGCSCTGVMSPAGIRAPKNASPAGWRVMSGLPGRTGAGSSGCRDAAKSFEKQ
jgi:hypothetical protein